MDPVRKMIPRTAIALPVHRYSGCVFGIALSIPLSTYLPPPAPPASTPKSPKTPTYISISISISIFHDGRDRKGERGGVGRGDMFMIYEYGCKGVGVEERERYE